MADPITKEVTRVFGQNAHVLAEDFMWSVRWTSIEGPYDDILAMGFQKMIEGGIERFWVGNGKARDKKSLLHFYLEESPGNAETEAGRKQNPGPGHSAEKNSWDESHQNGLKPTPLADTLLSESFTAYGMGISLAFIIFLAVEIGLFGVCIKCELVDEE